MDTDQGIAKVTKRVKKLALATERIEIEQGIEKMRNGFNEVRKVMEEEETNLKSFSIEEYLALQYAIYDLCSKGRERERNAEQLYRAYMAAFDGYLLEKVLPSLRHDGDYGILQWLERCWQRHSVMAHWLSRLLEYLDRSYLKRRGFLLIAEAAVARFRECVFDRVKEEAARAVLALIERERLGQIAVDPSMVRGASVTVFVAMGMGDLSRYEKDLEAAVLEDSSKYYSREAARWMESDTVPEYMARAEAALRRERERVACYLHPTTDPKMVAVVRQELLVAPASWLFEHEQSGFVALVRADNTECVEIAFRLYVEIPDQLKQLAELFQKQLMEDGTEVTRGEASLVINRLISLHKRYSVFLRDSFRDHELFHKAFVDAFKAFSNHKAVSVANLLAAFCNDILQNGERMSEDAVEDSLDSAAQLLVYINDKDLFVELHHQNLSDRLLSRQSKSDEHDLFLLGKLKQKVGAWSTQKLEGMFNDLRLAKESDGEYVNYLSENPIASAPTLSATVLTPHRWAISHTHERLSVPAEMARSMESFGAFYNTKFNSRKLSFFYTLGDCHIRGNFDACNIDLIVTPYQAMILTLFNDSDELSYSEIKAQLNAERDSLLKAALHSLSCRKYEILVKKPANNSISNADVFEYNSSFTNKATRIKISLPKIVEEKSEEERKASKDMQLGRGYSIDAALVRIMKSRKSMHYKHLVAECVNLLMPMFLPDTKTIKTRIDSLIDREYLERDAESPDILDYIA